MKLSNFFFFFTFSSLMMFLINKCFSTKSTEIKLMKGNNNAVYTNIGKLK